MKKTRRLSALLLAMVMMLALTITAGAEEVTTMLSTNYGIAVRGGYHCAGLAHKTIGTWETGAVRISVSPFSTKRDIDKLIDAVHQIGKR